MSILAAACLLAGLTGATAEANHSAPARVSAGAVNGQGALPALFAGASADGTRFWFHSDEQLAPSDTDDATDVYERAGTVTTQISTGPNGGSNDNFWAGWQGSSEDGKRIFFTTAEPLVASDTDDGCSDLNGATGACLDVYESSGGVLTLLSTGPSGGNGTFNASFRGSSADGSRVFIRTAEQLVPADTDSQRDVYQRSGGTTTLLSTGPSGGNGPFESIYRGASQDGTRVFLETEERLFAADTDSSGDVYERSSGATTLLSTGAGGGSAERDAAFRAASSDGSHVFFETDESLVAADTDSAVDVYDRSGGTTTLVSTGAGAAGPGDALYEGSSEGGTKVFFTSTDKLSGADTDSQRDVYERSGGAATLLSTGPAGGNGAFESVFEGAAKDGSHVILGTREGLVASDTDGRFDLYDRTGGSTTLGSTGTGSTNGTFDAFFRDISADGSRVIFETAAPVDSADTDLFPDLYERFGGVTTRLSNGAGGGNASQIAVFLGASDDATRVFFQTGEALDATDTDTVTDLYQSTVAFGYARPKGASPFDVPLMVAYKECTTGNRVHSPPALGGGVIDPSCAAPVQESSELTVGTPDANSHSAKSTSSLRFTVLGGNPATPADEADVEVTATINDVYHRGSPVTEYTGEVAASFPLQITDKRNGSVPQDPGTVNELASAGFTVPCAGTPDTTTGSSCTLATTADTLIPGLVQEGARTLWQIGKVTVTDGGSDGLASTAPNLPFMRQGLFAP